MSDKTIPPEQCSDMAQVRAGVDAVDRALVTLLAERFAYMRAAARIKPERGQVRDLVRKAQVVGQAQALAEASGVPVDLVAKLWDDLVEGSIAYELAEWERLKG